MLHSLQSLLDTTSGIPIENHQVFFILMEVALALHEIHSLGIAHLDIKPANVFISGDSIKKLKIGDFGLAAYFPIELGADREGDRTYMAPEVLLSDYGSPADIFR